MSDYHLFKDNGDSDTLLVTFTSFERKLAGIPTFEFNRFLSNTYPEHDHMLFTDPDYCWYHKGVRGITDSVETTVDYLNKKLKDYKKSVFIGVSSGGYASLLYGSLCDNVTGTVCFIPQTNLQLMIDNRNKNNGEFQQMRKRGADWDSIQEKYLYIEDHLNNSTKNYIITPRNERTILHGWHHVERIIDRENVIEIKPQDTSIYAVKTMRDNGQLKAIIDNAML